MALKSCTFPGRLKHCPPCYILAFSSFYLAFSFICSTSTTPPSMPRLGGLDFLQRYTGITIMPIFRHDSPYYAPLPSSAWSLYHGIAHLALQTRWLISIVVFVFLAVQPPPAFFLFKVRHLERFLGGIKKTVENTAWKLSAEIDCHIFKLTFDALDEDHELELFLRAYLASMLPEWSKTPNELWWPTWVWQRYCML